MKKSVLRIDPADDLIVALRDLAAGETVEVDGETVEIRQLVPAKHKFAARDFIKGETATLYGVIVGEATADIARGGRITVENLRHTVEDPAERAGQVAWTPPDPFPGQATEFMGYRRCDGRVGTANYWIVVPLVFCANHELDQLEAALVPALGYRSASPYERLAGYLATEPAGNRSPFERPDLFLSQLKTAPPKQRVFPNIDGIRFLRHAMGCGGTRADARALCSLLAGYITHPNVAGATVISLGCQNAEISLLEEEIGKRRSDPDKPVYYFDRQSWRDGDMLAAVIARTVAGMKAADETARRTPVPVSELIIGVECGGSDGFSGISANPVIGRTVDYIIGAGGSAILSEFPELYGVENDIVGRCVDPALADRFLALMATYRRLARQVGSDLSMNPSPGNIRDGLITDAMKSAGAAKKGGTSPIVDVLDYPEPVT